MNKGNIPAVTLIGPTGIGKTELSLEIAERFGGEIISVDSMQVYRFMDVGTAKANLEERGRVVHHLLDIVFPDEPYNVARFVEDATRALKSIRKRGRLPLLVGGTGLYLKGLLKGLFEIREDPKLRKVLQQRLEKKGVVALYEELKLCDPDSAARIHPNDKYRILRALEVYRTTGVPWSVHLARENGSSCLQNTLKLGLSCDREDLYHRIDKRVGVMVALGLRQEVENLLALGYSGDLKPMQAIGYRHMINFLAGRWPWEESLRLLARDTRRYAKRQLTWFRRDSEIQWFQPGQRQKIYAAIENYLRKAQKEGGC